MGHRNNDRLLLLRDILFSETDENHELDIYELKAKLMEHLNAKSIDNRTIKNDLDALEKINFEVMKNRRKFGKIYYSHQAKPFETYQLRFLVDAILSARFITMNEKIILINKLKEMTSTHISRTLPGPVVFYQTANLDNELVRINIDRIHHAIVDGQVLSYKYGNYDEKKEFVYRREGERYYVAPFALIWQNDFYYLIGEFLETGEIRNYRLDRIREISQTDQEFMKPENFDVQSYINNSFHMYNGEEFPIKIRFEKGLLNAMYDRFGLNVDVKVDGEDHFVIRTKAKVSDGLLSWILKWGSQAEVLEPRKLVDQVAAEVKRMMEIYEGRETE